MSNDEIAPLCREHGKQIAALSDLIHGKNGQLGLRIMVLILWRTQVVFIALVSAVVGALIRHLFGG